MRGGGWRGSAEDLAHAEIAGGPMAAAQNFGGGGAYAGVIETMTGPLGFFDGEMTMSDVRSAIDSLGLAVPGVPSTAINRIIKAEEARAAGGEVSPVAYIMGLPR